MAAFTSSPLASPVPAILCVPKSWLASVCGRALSEGHKPPPLDHKQQSYKALPFVLAAEEQDDEVGVFGGQMVHNLDPHMMNQSDHEDEVDDQCS
ncbi:hypothetical protein BDR05DRAFT_997157 [Suillus weaverae]|nr:hypothetical protein BDR05DRAFT_997157 [Suillus weaverae]